MRVLVAGGAGFIGSQFVRALLAGDYVELPATAVTVVDALTYAGRRENLQAISNDPRFRFVRGSIADRSLLDDVVAGHELVVNFAAESHVDRSIEGPLAFLEANVVGAATLLDACRRLSVGRMVQVSTDEVYGSINHGRFTEEDPLRPNSPYAAAKASADLFVRSYVQTFGLDVVITRCSNNYGPFQHPEKLIPRFTTNLIQSRHMPLYGDGGNAREWVHVSDHCRGIAVAATRGRAGEVYNIGGGIEKSNREIAQLLAEHFGFFWKEVVNFVPDRPGHDRRYAIDDSKIRRLGYSPSVGFEQGLHETVSWYRANEGWWRPLTSGMS